MDAFISTIIVNNDYELENIWNDIANTAPHLYLGNRNWRFLFFTL